MTRVLSALCERAQAPRKEATRFFKPCLLGLLSAQFVPKLLFPKRVKIYFVLPLSVQTLAHPSGPPLVGEFEMSVLPPPASMQKDLEQRNLPRVSGNVPSPTPLEANCSVSPQFDI